ncbi:MAG TPA: ComF family protein [Terriglobales bacterium]
MRSGLRVRRTLLHTAVSTATVALQGAFAALFPSDCRVCGVPLASISRLPVCSRCVRAMAPVSGQTCAVCGEWLAREVSVEPKVCGECEADRPLFTQATAYGAYDAELRELIHLLKYERVLPAAAVLGRMLAEAIRKLTLPAGSLLVVPVPLHRSKRRQRGFNQCELIARAALKQLPELHARLSAGLLVRRRATVSQVGLTRSQRAENIHGAFEVAHLNQVAGSSILLVDDVLTTATTAAECARVLRKAGAKDVWVATVARTFKSHAADFETGLDEELAVQAQ